MAILAILILLLAAVIALPLIAVARKRGKTDENSPALVITYLILVVASVIATSSFSSLVESILPGAVRIFEDPSDVALTLSTLIVAGLVWGSVWLALERRRSGPNTARGLYLALTAAIAMSVVAYGAVRVLALSVGVDEYEPAVVADLLSFGALWMLVEWWRRRDEQVNVLKLFWGSVIGFGLAAVGLGIVLTTSLQELLGERTILVGETDFLEGLRWGFAVLAIGVVYFVVFWLRGFALRPLPFAMSTPRPQGCWAGSALCTPWDSCCTRCWRLWLVWRALDPSSRCREASRPRWSAPSPTGTIAACSAASGRSSCG